MSQLTEDGNYKTLTDFEFDGLSARFGFADGHAYHDLDPSQIKIIAQLPSIWSETASRRQRDVEREFSSSFYRLAGQFSVIDSDRFRITTSASQSIDLACAWAARSRKRIGLVEPTFDNLALIVRRWDLPLHPIPEDAIRETPSGVDGSKFDCLFLVNPNNPTGLTLSEANFREIVNWCKSHNKTLICDFCFRFFSRTKTDYYQILEESEIDYISIEDTGKTWSTMDMKASIIAYSKNIKYEIEEIFHEIFLGVSPFVLAVLNEFVKDTHSRGLETTLWTAVEQNRARLREAIAGSFLRVDPNAQNSTLGLEWLRIDHPKFDDLSLAACLKKSGIACLPGRFFHWSLKPYNGHKNVRFALMKPSKTIERGIPILAEILGRL